MYSYRISSTLNTALLHFEGDVRGADLIGNARTALADPLWQPGMNAIWDCRGLQSLDVRPKEMKAMVKLRTQDTRGVDVWLVKREIDEGLARLYVMLANRKGKTAVVCFTVAEVIGMLALEAQAVSVLGL